ncbi:MAG TPA: hypothetical protein VJU59_29150 [Paraburkholderia sp.]|uniref:hypothetical protein n=1 Tax=Paraburkholderia sp. TaxID=1926495 RepID=UPI002B472B35|nr:hypothetical protein [Paraburkholderia sp.]HKR43697.1 hypothetical protein [Paraburkholderia sp.]
MKPTAIALALAWSAVGLVIPSAAGAANEATIAIVSGTYGSNCGAPHGNVTRDLAAHCDGLRTCSYPVSMVAAQSGGCRNDYLAEWRCGGHEFHNAALAPGAGSGDRLVLSCEPSSGPGH